MKVVSSHINIKTKGKTDIIDITNELNVELKKADLNNGTVTLFVLGSTAALTTIEYEPALISDIKKILERLIPSGVTYAHDSTWGDGNGYSHLRASFLGPCLTIPFKDHSLCLGTWQQIVLLDFDNRPRNREIIAQFIGE